MHPFPAPALIGRSIAPQTEALIARMTTPPTNLRRFLINRLIRRLIDSGAWAALSGGAFYVMAAADHQAGDLNWLSTSFALSPNGATFTADRGYAGASMTTGYSGYGGTNVSMGVWMNTDAGDAGYAIGGFAGSLGIRANNGGSLNTLAGGAAQSTSVVDGLGYAALSRVSSTDYIVRVDGGTVTKAVSGTATVSMPCRILSATAGDGSASGPTASRAAAAHVGTALTSAHLSAIEAALSEYLTAVGGA